MKKWEISLKLQVLWLEENSKWRLIIHLPCNRQGTITGQDLMDAVAEAIEEVSPLFSSEKRIYPAGSFTSSP